MDVKLKTKVGQLSIVAGVWQKSAPNLGVVEPTPLIPARWDKGNLYVLTEVTGDSLDDEACRLIVETITREYYRKPGSITFGLRQAIKAANSALFQENLESLPQWRRTAGVSGVVLRGDNLYIGQAGPALVYLIHEGELQRFPAHSLWLDTPDASALTSLHNGSGGKTLGEADTSCADASPPQLSGMEAVPLGVKKDMAVDLFHTSVQAGDVIVLSSSTLARLAREEEIAAAVAYQEMETAVENLAALAAGGDLSSIVVQISGEKAVRAEGRVRQMTRLAAADLVGLISGVWGLISRLDLPGLLGGIGRGLVGLFLILTRGLQALGQRILPGPAPRPRRRPARPREGRRPSAIAGGRKFLPMVGLLIPALLLVLVVFALFQYRMSREQEAQLAQLVEQAKQKKESALVSTEKAMTRTLLRQAQELIDRALLLNPAHPEANELREDVQAELDRINLVVRLPRLPILKEFPEADLSRVVVHENDVYILDKGTDRLYRYLLNEAGDSLQEMERPVLLRRGDQLEDIVVEELIDVTWMEVGGERKTSNLLALESGGALIECDLAGDLTVIPVADSETWQRPSLIGGYFGNFYLLDTQLNSILKYLSTPDGYTDPPLDYLAPETTVDLGGAVDMAIDGYIYVLLADGTILKFSAGVLEPFDQAEIDQPLRSPTAIFATPETEALYVADAGNKRIVQFSKEGRFQRQFRPHEEDAFDQLKGLFVDEAGGKLYILSGNKLYMADIPQ